MTPLHRSFARTLAGALAGLLAAPATAQPDGAALFTARCASCHETAPAQSRDPLELARATAPSLAAAGSKFRREWLAGWLRAPRRIRPAGYLPWRATLPTPEGDRIAVDLLPSHPALPASEAERVADHLMTLRQPILPYPLAEGGTDLRAEVHFHKLLPCGACHQSRPGEGGLSGPELYTAGERLQREWLLSFTADPTAWGSPWMPRVPLRADQLAAISNYLTSAPAGGPEAAPPAGARTVAGALRPPPLSADRGEALYRVLCSPCHGLDGDGHGINAPSMFVAPRDHSSFEEMSLLPRDRLQLAIKSGGTAVGKSALMPPWGSVLTAEDIERLVAWLRRLSGTDGL